MNLRAHQLNYCSLMFEFTQQAKLKWAQTGNAIKPTTGDMFIFPALLQHWVVLLNQNAPE